MIQQKLIVGRYITLKPPGGPLPYADGDFLDQPPQLLTLAESTTSGIFSKTKTSGVTPGQNVAKVHRNFQWLSWYPGAISQVPINGVDVLTGPMSGCWLCIYKRGGQVLAGHIGTAEPTSVKTIAVKASWNQFALAHPSDVIVGFNPYRHWAAQIPPKSGTDDRLKVFGLMTSAHQLFSVALYTQQSPAPKDLYRIAGVEQIVTAGIGTLQTI